MFETQWLPFLEFALCLGILGYAGVQLSLYGDVIADKTGLGGTWVGMMMLATVTSLPELVTGVTAVAGGDLPDIAVGDALGACVFNLCIFVLLDLLHRGESLYRRSRPGHILSASFGVLMLAFIGFSILLSGGDGQPALGHVGFYTPVIVLMYAAAVRSVFRYESAHVAEFADRGPDRRPDLSVRQAVLRYLAAALVVVGAGTWLPFIGERIAIGMGWQESFVGTVFIAVATTVPELVVSVTALRIGALDMAIANLLGSNLFNMLVLAIDDLFYLRGPLFAHVAPSHAVSALSAIMMTTLAIVGLFYRPDGRVLHTVGWTSIVVFVVYLLNTTVQFLYVP
ncbi:MAG: sodium:calcium antiporter [Burkholderiales bacterium]|nr:MAG: sodium:calcium antiporter [Burkholderiales bacterium]